MSGGLADMMKQAHAMQKSMQKAHKELAKSEVRGESGGGLVTVTMTGRHDVRKIEIEAKLMDDERAVLEELVAAAVNDAVRKVARMTEEKMGGLSGGLNLSDLKIPF